jgi:O-antigen/teichoic acid export membrane protein
MRQSDISDLLLIVDDARTQDGATTVAPLKESPARRSVAAGLLSVVSLALKISSNLLLIPLTLSFLGAKEYGLWIVLTTVGNCLALSEMGIGQTILNYQSIAFARGDYRGVNRVLTTVFGLYWLIIIPVGALAILCIVFTSPGQWLIKDAPSGLSLGMKPLLVLIAVLGLFRVPGNVFPATLLGVREIAVGKLLEIVQIISLTVVTAVVLFLGGGLLALLIAVHLGWILVPLLCYPVAKLRHPKLELHVRHWTPSILWPLLSNSFFFFLYALGLLFQRFGGNLLAGKFAGLAEVPSFFALLTLFRIVGWSLADIISQTLQPYIIMLEVQGRHDRVVFFAGLCTKLTFVLAATYATLVLLFAKSGLELWLGHGMFLGFGPLALLAGSFLIDVIFLATNNFMRGLNQHRALSIVMGVYAGLSFVLAMIGARLWTPRDPIYGLCLGLFWSSVLGQAALLPLLTQRLLRIRWRLYVDQFLIRPLLLLVCGPVLFVVISQTTRATGWVLAAHAVTFILCMGLLFWRVFLSREEQEWLAGVFVGRGLGAMRRLADL